MNNPINNFLIRWKVVRWVLVLGVSFEAYFKKWFDLYNFKTSRKRLDSDGEITKFRNLTDKLSIPAALDGFKPSKIFNILFYLFKI